MEITANALQTVEANQNVLFTDTVVCGNCSIMHRGGSGLVTLRGITNQCRARFKVFFSGNIALPTDGTVEAISLAISKNLRIPDGFMSTIVFDNGFLISLPTSFHLFPVLQVLFRGLCISLK